MKTRLGALALRLSATTAILGAVVGPAPAAAAEPALDEEIETAIASSDHTRLPAWLRHSIIACAAETMGERVGVVTAGLRTGFSLKEVAALHGVRASALKRGILDCEWHHLARLVEGGLLSRWQAYRVFEFIEDHIDRIINHRYSPDDAALSDIATDAAAPDAAPDAAID